MSTTSRDKPWDFSHVLDLVNRLSRPEQPPTTTQDETPVAKQDSSDDCHDSGIGEDVETRDFAKKPTNGLGDFAKIWQYMGVPDHKSVKAEEQGVVRIEDYASDGATYVKPATKRARTVTWEDQVSAEDLTGGSATDRSESPDTPKLTKSQRKKKNRRERKAQEAAAQGKSGVVSESEADVLIKRTPAKKAGVHDIAADLARRYNAQVTSTNATSSLKPVVSPAKDRPPTTPSKHSSSTTTSKAKENVLTTPDHGPTIRHHSQPATTTPTKHSQSAVHFGHYNKEKAAWEFETPAKSPMTQLVPSSVQPPKKKKDMYAANNITSQQLIQQPSAQQAVKAVQAAMHNVGSIGTPSKKSNNTIEPKIIRSGEDRNWALFLRLLNEHVEERKYLVAPMNLSNHNSDPNGIHVFVDASNIFIGFNDQLKRERGMPTHWHTSAANLSFDALALLMERRRPVAKRVLVGSTPSVAAFDTARAVGYEVSLLDKVYKARELTDRQIYFRDLDSARGGKRAKAPAAASGNTSSGSETNGDVSASSGPQYAPAKMIEQGVDEILHLKILESVVDSEVPSTMVIATGDAAQAEYSQGFMAMTERALKKGWKVELVSWSKNISSMYMRREFREKWGERFKVVFLDEYAEELLDM